VSLHGSAARPGRAAGRARRGDRTPKMRKTLRAAATDTCTFFALPGSPADTNMAAYCARTAASRRRHNERRARRDLNGALADPRRSVGPGAPG